MTRTGVGAMLVQVLIIDHVERPSEKLSSRSA